MYTGQASYGNSSFNTNGESQNNSYTPLDKVHHMLDIMMEAENYENTNIFDEYMQDVILPPNSGKEFRQKIYLPINDARNAGVAGTGNGYDNETGTFEFGADGRVKAENLMTQKFAYYVGDRRFDVRTSHTLDKQGIKNAVWGGQTTGTIATLDDLNSATSSTTEVQDPDGNYAGLLGMYLEKDISNVTGSATPSVTINYTLTVTGTLKTTVPAGTEIIKIDGKSIKTTNALDSTKTKAEIATEIANSINAIISGIATLSGGETVTFTLTHNAGKISAVFSGILNLDSAPTASEDEYTGETYTVYGLKPDANFYYLEMVKLVSGVAEGGTNFKSDVFTDPYLKAAIQKAKRDGLISSVGSTNNNSIEDIRIPLAERAQDTIQRLDVRNYYDPHSYHAIKHRQDSMLNVTGESRSANGNAAVGSEGFAFNLNSLVKVSKRQGIFAIVEGRPRGNAYGANMDYQNVTDNLPIIGEHAGRNNAVGFQAVTVNGTIMEIGRMMSMTADLFEYGNLGTPGITVNRTGEKYVQSSILALFTKTLHDQLLLDKQIMQQVDIMNNAGLNYYPGNALSMEGVVSPVNVALLNSVSQALIENKTQKHTQMIMASSGQGSVPLSAKYMAITGSRVIHTLQSIESIHNSTLNTWKESVTYAHGELKERADVNKKNTLSAEMGSIGPFRFVQMQPGTDIYFRSRGGVPPENLYYRVDMTVVEIDDLTKVENDPTIRGRVIDDFETDEFGRLVLHPIYVIGKDSIQNIKYGGRSGNKIQTKTVLPASISGKDPDFNDVYGKSGFMTATAKYGISVPFPNKVAVIYTPVLK
jgi:hypothetical protein